MILPNELWKIIVEFLDDREKIFVHTTQRLIQKSSTHCLSEFNATMRNNLVISMTLVYQPSTCCSSS